MNKENLLKLAAGLRARSWPEGVEFDMTEYSDSHMVRVSPSKQANVCHYADRSDCGSVGCAIGIATYIVEPRQLSKDVFAENQNTVYESWMEYSIRVFGISGEPAFDIEPQTQTQTWRFMFAAEWHRYDNTPEGAADRIEYVVEHGNAPDRWDFNWKNTGVQQ